MPNITTDNINTIAQAAASIGDGDYILIYKGGAQAFSKIEFSAFNQGAGAGVDISEILSNDWNDSNRQHVPSARQMNLMYNNMISLYNSMAAILEALANSAFKTASPTIGELDWVGDSSFYSIGYSLTHCHKSPSSPMSVAEGESFTAEIIPDAGYTMNGVRATGNGFSQFYDDTNDKIIISASNVQNGLTIGCTAATFQVSVNYSLTGFESESNITMQSGGSFVKELLPNDGYKVKIIVITMGGVALDNSQVWDAATNTITIPVVTGNIVITATAEESTAHTITYNLTGATKSSNSPIEVEDGESLTAVIAKDSSTWDGPTGIPFLARDIVVLMGGQPLERSEDFLVQQSAPDANITISIEHVTGNVEIVNVVWKNQYIFYKTDTISGVTTNAGGVGGTPNRSAHTSTYIPLASSCRSLALFGRNGFIAAGYDWGCAVYDANKAFKQGIYLDNSEQVLTFDNPPASYIRTSAYLDTNNSAANEYADRINACYIYDITNDKFIWYGTSVDKSAVRNNHQNS